MSNASNLDIWAVIGFGFGLVSFFKGFKIYREYRILCDTPQIPIRSIAMGLVHVHGKAQGEQMVTSPVTQTPCYFYKVDIEKYERDSKGNGSWSHYKSDANGVRFYLQDATGKVMMDALNAQYDLMQTCKRETGGSIGRGLGRLFGRQDDATLASGPSITDSSLLAYAESLSAGGGSLLGNSLGQFGLGGAGLNLSWGSGSSGQFRFTEYCVLKDHWYDVTGTCVGNPNPTDEHDRNLIMKGQNEPTFLISWRAEKAIESTLRNRSALYIFGGAALSVVCLGALLASFGWF
jgi:hypothetical protein